MQWQRLGFQREQVQASGCPVDGEADHLAIFQRYNAQIAWDDFTGRGDKFLNAHATVLLPLPAERPLRNPNGSESVPSPSTGEG